MNNTPNNYENLRDTAAAFVLGALPEIEAQAFRRQMMRDSELAAWVKQFDPVVDQMLLAVPEADPPDSLRDAIIEEARRDAEASAVIASPRPKPSTARGFGRKFGAWAVRPAVGLAVVTLIAGAFVVGRTTNGGDPGRSNDSFASASFMGTADPNASGKITMIGDGTRGAVVKINGLNPRTGDDVYQLWIQHGDEVEPSSLFEVDKSGRASSVVLDDMSDVDAVMITREPPGGSPRPTSDVLATAKLN
ncbi:MAG TPA: anti-sigma factor [Solirubrobacterales bacterium]|jgi:anti-sigma-K factor RskA|nr:anti-sigma factor [Solirubrobacterales bacterium]